MKLTRNRVFPVIFVFSLIVNLSVIFDIRFLFLRAVLSSIYLTIVPGLLISLSLKIKRDDYWEYLIYCIGLSVAYLMFAGLLFNYLLPLVGVKQPLSLIPISLSLQALLLPVVLVAYLRNKGLYKMIRLPRLSLTKLYFSIIPLLFPVLSIFGAVSLNNSGSNVFTMILLGGIALYVSLLIIFRKRLDDNIYIIAIYFIALSLLLMTSLRGWYTTGHDNQREYYVFQLTKYAYRWNISLYQNTYNACLSLNILPTIYSSFTDINDLYIYKIIFQCIFPFSVIGIFLLLKKYAVKSIAFLSAFFFMSFPVFSNDMPMLNRQEISMLFFTLTLLVLFNRHLKPRMKEALFIIFAFSMVVSHYSTSYIATALVVLTYLISLVIKFISKRRSVSIGNNNYYLSLKMVVGILLFTFIWNSQLTNTTGGLTSLLKETWQNIGKSFNQDLKSSDVLYSIFNWKSVDKSKLLNDYVAQATTNTELSTYKLFYFDKNIYQKYPITLVKDYVLPLTSLGRFLKSLSIDSFSLNYYFKQISAKLVQLLLVIGFVVLVLKKSSYLRQIDSEYAILAFISICLLGVFILLPFFSVEYGTLRFFLQTLTILALPTVVGCLTIFKFLKKGIPLYTTLAFFILFFLSLYGFIPQVTGGFYPLLNLNNQGVYYDAYYKHKSEITSVDWLSKNYNKQYFIQSNSDASSKLFIFSGFYPETSILPVSVGRDSYVYLNYSIIRSGNNIIYYKGNTLIYQYPLEFLNENKNLIYNNHEVEVYK